MIGSNCSLDLAEVALNNPPAPPKSFDPIENIASVVSYVRPATAVARKSKYFARLHKATNDKVKMTSLLMSDYEDLLHEMNELPQESKDRLNAVFEYLRLSKTAVRDTGRNFALKTRELRREGADGIERRFAPELSKPGQTLKLNANETRILHEAREYLESRYTLNAKSQLSVLGYDGEYSRKAIEEGVEDDGFRDDLLRLFDAIESQRLTSYIPFMRSGDTKVIVYGPDGTLDSGAFYMIDSLQWLRDLVGKGIAMTIPDPSKKRIAEIKAKYPESEGYRVITDSRDIPNQQDRLSIEDLPNLDKLLSLMDARSGGIIKDYYDRTMGGMFSESNLGELTENNTKMIAKGIIADLPKSVRSVLMQDLAAGFMKQSRDIAGYDTNFTDRLLDYNRIVATTVAHRMYRKEYAEAYDDLQNNVNNAEKEYAKEWDQYVDTPEGYIARGLKTIGFFNSMWASVASSSVNAMSVWTVTAQQMTVMKGSAGLDTYKMAVQVMAGFRGKVGYGMHVDPNAIPGLTDEERDALVLANKRGTVRAQMNPELMGIDSYGAMSDKGSGLKKTAKRYFQYGSSVISVTEEMNKAAAFIVAYRYAKDPKALKNWKEAYGKNERAKIIIKEGSNPYDVAEFMVETATFMGGQIEKPPIMRGAGGVILQFSQYPLQIMFLLAENLRSQGPRGKVAAMFTLMIMWTVSGLLYAIPFGDDAVNFFQWIYNMNSEGAKKDFRTEAQLMLAEMFGNGEAGRRDAEMLLRGPSRELLGLNFGERVGFTTLIPEFESGIAIAPAISTTVSKFQEYLQRRSSGVQPVAANVALVSPFIGKGPTDLLKGFVQYPLEGYRTRYGSLVIAPEDMGFVSEQLPRATGFQSAKIAREMQARQAGKMITESTRNAERKNTLILGKLLADAIKAEDAGDNAKAEKILAQFDKEMQLVADKYEKEINAGNFDGAVKPPTEQTLKNAMMAELYPGMKLDRVGKLKREAYIDAYRTILVDEEEGDLIPEEEEEEFVMEEEGGFDPAFPQ
jgi:hypothetical protein